MSSHTFGFGHVFPVHKGTDLPYKYTWNRHKDFSLVSKINETRYKILELHLKVNDEQVCKDVFVT